MRLVSSVLMIDFALLTVPRQYISLLPYFDNILTGGSILCCCIGCMSFNTGLANIFFYCRLFIIQIKNEKKLSSKKYIISGRKTFSYHRLFPLTFSFHLTDTHLLAVRKARTQTPTGNKSKQTQPKQYYIGQYKLNKLVL